MGQWKKILTSGSAAEVTNLTTTGTVTFGSMSQVTTTSNLVAADANGVVSTIPSSNFMPSSGGSTAGEFIFWSGSLSEYGSTSSTTTAATDFIKFVSSGGSSPRPELVITGSLQGDVDGNASSADTLSTARNIGGVSFDGSANIDLPGVNTAGTQNTSGKAATAGTADQVASSLTDGDGIADFTYNGSAAVSIAVDTTVVRTSGDQSIAGNKTFSNNVTISGDLVVNGASTVIDTTNLLVEDRYITLASGSSTDTPGGIVVQNNSNGSGFAFYYNTITDRWMAASGVSATETGNATTKVHMATGVAAAINGAPTAAPVMGGATNGHNNFFNDTVTGDLYVYVESGATYSSLDDNAFADGQGGGGQTGGA